MWKINSPAHKFQILPTNFLIPEYDWHNIVNRNNCYTKFICTHCRILNAICGSTTTYKGVPLRHVRIQLLTQRHGGRTRCVRPLVLSKSCSPCCQRCRPLFDLLFQHHWNETSNASKFWSVSQCKFQLHNVIAKWKIVNTQKRKGN